jgi:DNA-binding NarL/FixJ family response regulator
MRLADLTPAQQRIVRLRARGYTNAKIALLIGSSIHTVRTHCHQICLRVLGEEDRPINSANNFIKVLRELFDLTEKT